MGTGRSLNPKHVTLQLVNGVHAHCPPPHCPPLQAAFWMWTGTRQTGKLRQAYLSAVLRQDVEYFDTQATTGSLLQVWGVWGVRTAGCG